MSDEIKTVLCFGDSNTHGYNPQDGTRFGRDIRWTGLLQHLLGDSYLIIEEGCNGRTTVRGDWAEGWINGMAYLRPCLYSHRPVDYVVMMLGTNDLKACFQATAEAIAEGMQTLVRETIDFMQEHQQKAPHIILIAPPVLGDGMAKSVFADEFTEESVRKSYALAELYKEIANRYYCTFLNASEFVEVSEADSLHLSADSHAKFAEELYHCICTMEKETK